jgi:transcriptional regulator with XRE-family HTH domain
VPYSRNLKLLKNVSLRIKELREEHNVTQEAFYHDTGINISRIEMGKNDLSLSTLKRICDYFGIDLKDFFRKGF